MKNLISYFTKLLVILLFISNTFVLFLVLNTRVNRETIEQILVEEITLTDQSKEVAEAKNLTQALRNPNPNIKLGQLKDGKGLHVDSTRNDLQFSIAFELQSDFTIRKINEIDDSFIPILIADHELINQLNEQNNTISLTNAVTDLVQDNKLSSLAISKEFTKLNSFFEFLDLIQEIRNVTRIYLFLYPRWGFEPNYKHFFQIDNALQAKFTPFEISQKADFLVLPTFGFTNEFSILPHKITDFDLVERMIQFHISQKVPSFQLILQTTQNAYVWPKREIPNDYYENYSWFEKQAEVLPFDSLTDLRLIKQHEDNEFFLFQNSGNESIVVRISPDSQEKFKDLAIKYGLYGLISD